MIWMNDDDPNIDAAVDEASKNGGFVTTWKNGRRCEPSMVDYRFAVPRAKYIRPPEADYDPRTSEHSPLLKKRVNDAQTLMDNLRKLVTTWKNDE